MEGVRRVILGIVGIGLLVAGSVGSDGLYGDELFLPPKVIAVDGGVRPAEAAVGLTPDLAVPSAESRSFREAPAGGAWHGWHRTQGLAVRVAAGGLDLARTPGAGSPWVCRLETTRVCDSSESFAVGPARASAEGTRVTLERDGLTEWIEIAEDGVRLEWLVHRPPGGRPSGSLRLEIAVRSGLRLRQDPRGGIEFLDGSERVALCFSGLAVWDALGRELPAGMGIEGDSLVIHVDTNGAVFPIWIDPLANVPSAILLSDQSLTGIGYTLATLRANDDDYDDLAVGEAGYDVGALTWAGRVSVYFGSAFGLTDPSGWMQPGQASNAWFGTGVASAGDTNGDSIPDLLIQRNGPPPPLQWAGEVFVFPGGPQGLGSAEIWSATGSEPGARFGDSLAAAGDVNGDGFGDIAIGAPDQGIGGAFHVYHGSPSGPEATPNYSLLNANQSRLAFALAGAGDQNGDGYDDLLVADYLFPDIFNDLGRVYLHLGSASGLQSTPAWFVDPPPGVSAFGLAVVGGGDVNGDGFLDVGVSGFVGTFVYLGSSSGLATTPAWTGPGQNLSFADVNGDGFTDVIAADRNLADNSGAVWCFLGGPTGLGPNAAWSDFGPAPAYQLGLSIAAGDLNGDGLDDLAVGAREAVHIYLATPAQFRRGDANGDATFNLADAVFTLSHLFGTSAPAPACADAADSNDDGAINIADPIHTLNALFTSGALPTLPGPTMCGSDPTPDALGCDALSCP
ncbi:MAG: FG-GAP-like repeat-containing protein [Planctomycetota bacterium]